MGNPFSARLEQACCRARRYRHSMEPFAVHINADRSVFENAPRGALDGAVTVAAGRIKALLRDTDTLARMGRTEHAVALQDLRRVDMIHRVAHKLLEAFDRKILLGDNVLVDGINIGGAVYPEDGMEIHPLFRKAQESAAALTENRENNTHLFAGMPRPGAGPESGDNGA